MTGLGLGADADVLAVPAAAGVVAGLAEAALFVFWLVVASAAFFFVGIVAFRSVVATAAAAAVLVEIAAGFTAGREAALTAAFGLSAVLPRAALGVPDAFAFPAAVVLPPAGLVFVLFDAAARALAAAETLDAPPVLTASTLAAPVLAVARGRAGAAARAVAAGVALARLTEAAGCAAVRAAAREAAAGVAVCAEDFDAVFAAAPFAVAFEADLAVFDVTDLLAVCPFPEAVFGADFVAAAFVDAGLADLALADVDFAAMGLRTADFAALLPRAAGLVLGDMSATPEIGRSPGA